MRSYYAHCTEPDLAPDIIAGIARTLSTRLAIDKERILAECLKRAGVEVDITDAESLLALRGRLFRMTAGAGDEQVTTYALDSTPLVEFRRQPDRVIEQMFDGWRHVTAGFQYRILI